MGHRTERVATLVRSALCSALLYETHDTTLQKTIITEVEMTRDLRIAKIFYTSAVPEKDFRVAIAQALPSLRKRLAEGVELRYVPELQFFRDTHNEEVQHIYQLLNEVHAKPTHSDEV